jgi:hypothetical protein
VGAWYWIGVTVGLGAALGVFLAGILAGDGRYLAAAVVLAAGAGAGIGFAIGDWKHAVGGAIGGVAGAFGGAQVAAGTLRRGGTRAGTAVLFALAALVVGALAFVPAVGYLEAVALPLLGFRLRRRSGARYAGLRILARD